MLNLDTHVLLFAVAGALTSSERQLLSRARWSISAISLWEIAKLAQLGRIAVDLEDPDVVRVLGRVHVWPLTREIAHASTRLDVKGDPADQIIAATSLVHGVPLVTRDKVIRRSKRVPFPS
jgi:PIN domain nuclease of toxin-antitoxin system